MLIKNQKWKLVQLAKYVQCTCVGVCVYPYVCITMWMDICAYVINSPIILLYKMVYLRVITCTFEAVAHICGYMYSYNIMLEVLKYERKHLQLCLWSIWSVKCLCINDVYIHLINPLCNFSGPKFHYHLLAKKIKGSWKFLKIMSYRY